jgi:HCOMODA/2-hydroxy-3-carboxy-muconic semialdehyde decarboxylase
MRGHGSVVVGASLPIALGRTIYLDHNARMQAQTLQLANDPDEVVYLDDEEVQALSWQAYARSWDLWQTQWTPRLAAEAALRASQSAA